MRDCLRKNWNHELDSADFDYTIRSVRNIISDRNSVLCLKRESAAIRNPEHVDDIMDDVAYYTNLENRYSKSNEITKNDSLEYGR